MQVDPVKQVLWMSDVKRKLNTILFFTFCTAMAAVTALLLLATR